MTGWPLLPTSMIDALGEQAAASPWPQWAWWVDRDETAWVNPAAAEWLRAAPAELASATAMHALIERRQAGNAPLLLALDLFAVTAQPLRREWLLGHERSDPEAPCVWQELTRLRVLSSQGELLVFRVRPAADHEVLLAHGGHGGEAPALGGGAGLGVARVDGQGGLHWEWRDGWFARLPSADPPADAVSSVTATTRGGLALFDALLVVQAVHQQEATSWTVMVDLPAPEGHGTWDRASGGVPWRLQVQPRPGTSACLLGLLPPPVETVDAGLPWRPGPTGLPPVSFQCRADARLVFLSEDWPLLLGVSRAQAMGSRLTDFCPAPLDVQGPALLEPLLSGRERELRVEWPFRHADGDWRWLEVRLRPAPGGAERAVGTLVDITERCRSRQLERIVATALEHTVNGVVITDATRAENPIVHVNRGFTRLTGFESAEVLGRNCAFLQGDDRAQPEIGVISRAIRERQAVSVTLRNYRKDGTLFWNQLEISPVTEPVTGLVTHFLALQTDVTLKRRAEEANLLRALELERVFRGSPMGMVTFDPDGRIHLLSPPFLKLVGLQAAALLGRDATALREAVAARAGVPAGVLPWPDSGQHVSWKLPGPPERVLDVSLSALGRDGGERIAFFRDVTDEQTEIATRSRFLATAAHELRTPLGSICGFTELMLVRNYTREQARPMLETVLRQAMRLSALLNDLLDLSQMDTVGAHAFPLAPVDLGEVMQRAVQVAAVPGGGREIQVTPPAPGTWVTGHAAKLEQVLINLLSNALKYSPDGGPVALGASLTPEGIAVAVSDQGLGLSPEQQAKLFTRFFRADPSGPIPGTGLGLVIVKELVERMGGRVEVSSRLGEGSTFTVHLRTAPVVETAPPSPVTP